MDILLWKLTYIINCTTITFMNTYAAKRYILNPIDGLIRVLHGRLESKYVVATHL